MSCLGSDINPKDPQVRSNRPTLQYGAGRSEQFEASARE